MSRYFDVACANISLTAGVSFHCSTRVRVCALVPLQQAASAPAPVNQLPRHVCEAVSMQPLHVFAAQTKACDAILARMEQVVGSFQADLGRACEEIRGLQVQTQSMSTRLHNRRSVEAKLGPLVDNIIITEELVSAILEGEVR